MERIPYGKHTKEFRQEAVKLVIEGELSIHEAEGDSYRRLLHLTREQPARQAVNRGHSLKLKWRWQK